MEEWLRNIQRIIGEIDLLSGHNTGQDILFLPWLQEVLEIYKAGQENKIMVLCLKLWNMSIFEIIGQKRNDDKKASMYYNK